VWEVAQVNDPTEARLPRNSAGRFPNGYTVLSEPAPAPDRIQVQARQIRLLRNPAQNAKIGGDSPEGWAEASVVGATFRVSAPFQAGRDYPDSGCGYEIYTSPDPTRYVELELLGPLERLAPGGQTIFTTRWRLSPASKR
jgi:hypothetical protein